MCLFVMDRAFAQGLPACSGPSVGRPTAVVRIGQGGELLLRDGRIAHLEGIRLPLGSRDHAPDSFGRDAHNALSSLAIGRALTLTGVSPIEDRYGRLRVQAFANQDWIQVELLGQGLARVSIAPDRADCAAELYEAEARGRAMRAGLWSASAYSIRRPNALDRDLGTFQVVEGHVVSVSEREGHAWLLFASQPGARFAAYVSEDDLRTFRAMGVDPKGYEGQSVRVRGIVQDLSGPAIAIANPMQVEVIGQN